MGGIESTPTIEFEKKQEGNLDILKLEFEGVVEYSKLANIDVQSDEGKEILKKYGIVLDSGPIEVIIAGEKIMMSTDSDDFGTAIENPVIK